MIIECGNWLSTKFTLNPCDLVKWLTHFESPGLTAIYYWLGEHVGLGSVRGKISKTCTGSYF